MLLGVVFALLALGVGALACRVLRVESDLAPLLGLASLAVTATWGIIAFGFPAAMVGISLLMTAAVGLRAWRPSPLVVVVAAAPVVVLGVAFAGLEVPVSNHDGAFHVETIDALRTGSTGAFWYPRGYHASVAAFLALMPWLDTAGGTLDLSQGLSVLAPLAVFGLGRAAGLSARAAAIGGVLTGVTFVWPYDYQLWEGWPLGMSLLLVLGVWWVALRWIATPDWRWAGLAGVFGAAIVLTHGTEAYTACLGLGTMALMRARAVNWRQLTRHGLLAISLAGVLILPYLASLVGWAGAGGAMSAGEAAVSASSSLDWLQLGIVATGASALPDLLPRAVLMVLGLRIRHARVLAGVWLVFMLVLVGVDLFHSGWLATPFALTYPWLADHRLGQVTSIAANLLGGAGLASSLEWLLNLRLRRTRPTVWRRLAIGVALLLGFFAEGDAVSVYKRLADGVQLQIAFTTDDRAAMAWLRGQPRSGEVLLNDAAADAGIWAPYKAGIPILLPRIGGQGTSVPADAASVCDLHVGYVYRGSKTFAADSRTLPPVEDLERAPNLEEVFRSGDAAIFRVRLPCA